MKKILITGLLAVSIACASAQSTEQPPASADSSKTAVDSSALYGFIPELPVKVGGGPAEQRRYLESLRDARGKKISYEREGSCCPYPSSSPTALFGTGMLDRYVINYRDANNKKKKVTIYITFYDYEEPKAVKGFTFK